MASLEGADYLDEGMRGFIVNTALENYWRVQELCDMADLVQDGYLCFYKCYDRYVRPRKDLTASKDERRWFQALVKTTFLNHISTLAAKHKGVSERPASDYEVVGEEGTTDVFEQNMPPQPEMGTFMALLASAPTELLQLIKLLANDSADVLTFKRKRVGRRLLRETNNEMYCRLLGLDPSKRDIEKELKAHFG